MKVECVLRNMLADFSCLMSCCEVLTYVADSPSHRALLRRSRSLVGLAVNAKVHDVVAADSAVVDNDVPCPQGNGVPLQNLSVFAPSCFKCVCM